MTKRTKSEQRKRGRPPADQRVANVIMELARKNRALYAKQVLRKAKAELKKRTKEQDRPEILKWPGIRRTQDLVSKARGDQREEGTLDAPWSMALFLLPPDEIAQSDRVLLAHAAGRLLEIYRRCLIVGQRFTVRQAIWAARLADALPKADFSPLHSWAYMYASREKTALALGQPMDTSDLDANLAFIDMPEAYGAGGVVRMLDNLEYQNAILAGDAKRQVTLSREEQLLARHDSSAQAEERSQGLMTWHNHGPLAWVEQEELGLPPPVTPLAECQMRAISGPVPSEWRPKISERNALVLSAANVTVLWLRRISETPTWKAKSSHDRRIAAERLENIIKKELKEMAAPWMPTSWKEANPIVDSQAHVELVQFLWEFGLDPWPGWADRFASTEAEKRRSEKGGAP